MTTTTITIIASLLVTATLLTSILRQRWLVNRLRDTIRRQDKTINNCTSAQQLQPVTSYRYHRHGDAYTVYRRVWIDDPDTTNRTIIHDTIIRVFNTDDAEYNRILAEDLTDKLNEK